MESQLSLANSSVDIFAQIISLVSSSDIYRLWATGSSMLQARLRQKVSSFDLGTRFAELKLFPSVILNFIHLKTIHVNNAKVKDPYNMPNLPLERLAPIMNSIETLSIVSSDVWFLLPLFPPSFCTLDQRRHSLSSVFTKLKHLIIGGEASTLNLFQDFWLSLPYTLETLVITSIKVEGLSKGVKMPRLTRLEVQFAVNTKEALNHLSLPPTITLLQIRAPDIRDDQCVLWNEKGELRWKLPNLRKLHLTQLPKSDPSSNSSPSFTSLSVNTTFPDLEILECWTGTLEKNAWILPNSLTSLTLHAPQDLQSPGLDASHIALLPGTLVNLCFKYAFHDDATVDLRMIRALPKSLKTLEIHEGCPPTDAHWTDEELTYFPKTITHQNFILRKKWSPHQFIGVYFPSLRFLPLQPELPHACLSVLPRGLQQLQIPPDALLLPSVTEAMRLSHATTVVFVLQVGNGNGKGSAGEKTNKKGKGNGDSSKRTIDLTSFIPRTATSLTMSIHDTSTPPTKLTQLDFSHPEYFYCLKSINMLLLKNASFGPDLWPSSLETVNWHSTIDLLEFCRVAPPSLTSLVCHVFILGDEEIEALPRKLKTLEIQSALRVSYHCKHFLHLPRSITKLFIPLPSDRRPSRAAPQGVRPEDEKLLPPKIFYLRYQNQLNAHLDQEDPYLVAPQWIKKTNADLRGDVLEEKTTGAKVTSSASSSSNSSSSSSSRRR